MNYENIQLKGVTRKPDDSLSSNGELAIALDLVHDGDGLRTGEQPTQLFTTEGKSVIFIHQNAGYKHYISYAIANNVTTLYYRVGASGTDTAIHTLTGGITAISSVGNTIIVNDGTGLNYILWDASQQTYRFLGQKPPMVDITFGLLSNFCCYPAAAANSEDNGGEPAVMENTVDSRVVPIPRWSVNDYWIEPQSQMPADWVKYANFSLKNRGGTEGTGPVEVTIGEITQFVMANINAFINKEGTEKNRFIFPFFVRYAYELYDGSYIMHSVPTLMIPNSQGPIFGLYSKTGGEDAGYGGLKLNGNDAYDHNAVNYLFRGRAYGFASTLLYNVTNDVYSSLEPWKDIVKNVSVFVTPPVYTHDQSGEVTGWKSMDAVTGNTTVWDKYFTIGTLERSHSGGSQDFMKHGLKEAFDTDGRVSTGTDTKSFFLAYSSTFKHPAYIFSLPMRDASKLNEQLKNTAQFYRIAKLEINSTDLAQLPLYREDTVPGDLGGSSSQELVVDLPSNILKIEEHKLDSLTSQIQLTNDYYSHDILASSVLYPYNRRLNLGGITRYLHNPLPCTVQWMRRQKIENNSLANHLWKMAVYSKHGGKESITITPVATNHYAVLPHYVFVPDPDAYKVLLNHYDGSNNTTIELKLESHPYLHGAFWLGDITMPYEIGDSSASQYIVSDTFPTNKVNGIVEDFNLVYTSEAENPFVFTPENVNAVGDGRILALCSNTTMLSHDVFGREPMYVFTEQGVWPMTVGVTGVFTSVQMPNVRDVILPGTKPLPITQDILFLTKRGLLAMHGNSAKVVSEDINNDFLAEFDKLTELVTTIFDASYAAKVNAFTDFRNDSSNARLAYDYRNQRVYVALGNGCWVLNLKSTLWTQSSTVIGTPLNSFPDCEFATDNSVYTIGSARKDTGLLLTRPVKTGSEFYANIKEMAARGNFSINDAPVVTALFGTRNFINNYLLKSSTRPRITRFGGSPFKAHSFLAAIKNPSALVNMADKTYIDRFVIGIDTFQRNKLR